MLLNKENFNLNRSLIVGVILFILGIIVGYYTELQLSMSLPVLGGLFLLWGWIGYFFNNNTYAKIVIYCLIILIGIIWVDWFDSQSLVLKEWEGERVYLTGQVVSVENNKYILEVHELNNFKLKSHSKVLVRQNRDYSSSFQWEDTVKINGYLVQTVPRTNPGGFSEREFWRTKGIKYKMYMLGKGELIKEGSGVKKYISKIQQEITNKVTALIPLDESGIVLGLILGDKSKIAESFYADVQRLGIAHIFAVSGLHVGFLIALYLALSQWLKLSSTITIGGAIIILGIYSVLTGLTSSVVRASIMAILTLLAFKWFRFRDFYTLLAVAALIILIFNPMNLFTIGFQLSFITTWGLVYFYSMAEHLLSWLPVKLRQVLAVPMAAQIAALPIVAYHFSMVSLWAPLVNILVVPVIAILVPLLFVAIALSLVWIKIAEPFLLLAGGLISALQFLLGKFIAVFSTGHVYIAQPHIAAIIFYFTVLIGYKDIDFIKSKLSVNARMYLSMLLIIGLVMLTLPQKEPLEVTFLDVGQGDSAVIETPLKQFIVIDGGPSINTLARFLQYKGVNEVALIILSHPDKDHIAGLFKVIKDIPTRVLLVPPDVENNPALQELKNLALERNTKVIEGQAGITLNMPGDFKWEIISPNKNSLQGSSTNNASLVMQGSYGQQDIFFTGDIDNYVLKRLLPRLEDIEIMKVPHHGSKGSNFNGLYSKVRPHMAVISVGRSNRYGHPHPTVVKDIKDNGIEVFRTDRQGAVILKLVDNKWQVKTMLSNNENLQELSTYN